MATKLWEYKVVVIKGDKYCKNEAYWSDENAIHIDELGKQGWELVQVIGKAQMFKEAFFKRRKMARKD